MNTSVRVLRASRLTIVGLALLVIAACNGATPSVSPTPTPTSQPSVTPPSASPSVEVPPSESPTPVAHVDPAAAMRHPRITFRSVLLTDGTLLAVGDDGCGLVGARPGSELAEVYDPTADTWTKVGSLNKPRGYGQLVALPAGRAMVLGGVNAADEEFSSTKLYSPSTRKWTDGPLLHRAGVYAAVALADGTVVSVGLGGTEILDPGTSAWRRSTPAPKVFIERMFALPDGTVLAVGENDNEERDAAFLTFDAGKGSWKRLAAPSSARADVVVLEDGSIVVIATDERGTRSERYDAAAGRWMPIAAMQTGRAHAQVTRLADGRILVAGGVRPADQRALDTTEIYDPATDTWTSGPKLLTPRQRGYAMTMSDGSVLVYGGHGATPDGTPGTDTGSEDCPPPIATTERVFLAP